MLLVLVVSPSLISPPLNFLVYLYFWFIISENEVNSVLRKIVKADITDIYVQNKTLFYVAFIVVYIKKYFFGFNILAVHVCVCIHVCMHVCIHCLYVSMSYDFRKREIYHFGYPVHPIW